MEHIVIVGVFCVCQNHDSEATRHPLPARYSVMSSVMFNGTIQAK